MPLLVLLLPRRVEALAEGDAAMALSRTLPTGAFVASVGVSRLDDLRIVSPVNKWDSQLEAFI